MFRDIPSNDSSGEDIDDRGDVAKTLLQSHIRNISSPDVFRVCGNDFLHEIRDRSINRSRSYRSGANG